MWLAAKFVTDFKNLYFCIHRKSPTFHRYANLSIPAEFSKGIFLKKLLSKSTNVRN